jgi:hypothetical protein
VCEREGPQRPGANMKPLVIILVLPVLIGIASEFYFRDAKRASLAAGVGSALVVFLGVIVLDPAGTWNWVAALLLSPLPIAFGVVTVLYCYGRLQMGRRHRGHGA